MATKRTRSDLSLEEKKEILLQIESAPPGTTFTELGKAFAVSRQTIAKIKRDSAHINSALLLGTPKSVKRIRSGKNPEVEMALAAWFFDARSTQQPVSGPVLKRKAEEFAKKFGKPFTATEGWLSRWKSRQGIRFKGSHGERTLPARDCDVTSNNPQTWPANGAVVDDLRRTEEEYSAVGGIAPEIKRETVESEDEGEEQKEEQSALSVSGGDALRAVSVLYHFAAQNRFQADLMQKLDDIEAAVNRTVIGQTLEVEVAADFRF